MPHKAQVAKRPRRNPVHAIARSRSRVLLTAAVLSALGAAANNAAAQQNVYWDLNGTTANNRFLQYSFNTASVFSNDVITITPSAVPEPGTLALCGVGLGGVAAYRRRRRAG